MKKEEMKQKIKALKHLECWTYPLSDYGRAEVWRMHNNFIVFEIPQFGGTPRFGFGCNENCINYLLREIEKWN